MRNRVEICGKGYILFKVVDPSLDFSIFIKKEKKMINLKADIDLLLECMKCQLENPSSLKQALLTLTSICSNSQEVAQAHLRKCGGLELILKILTTTLYPEVKEAAMYTLGCAVDGNVFSQRELTSSSIFAYIHSTLTSPKASAKTLHTAVFLVISLVANNGAAQLLAKNSGCLESLIEIVKQLLPSFICLDNNIPGTEQNQQLFAAVASAICVCINNPQNDDNQRSVASLFPVAFQYIGQPLLPAILKSVASFIGQAASNNVHNQQRVITCNGLDALIAALHRIINRIVDSSDLGAHVDAGITVVSTINTVIAENVNSALYCGRLGIIPLLLKLLSNKNISLDAKAQITLTLVHCIDGCKENQQSLISHGGMQVLVAELGQTNDEELTRTIKYALQQCVSNHDLLQQVPVSSDSSINLNPAIEISREDPILQKIQELEAKLDASTRNLPNMQQLINDTSEKKSSSPIESSSDCIDIFAKEKTKSVKNFVQRINDFRNSPIDILNNLSTEISKSERLFRKTKNKTFDLFDMEKNGKNTRKTNPASLKFEGLRPKNILNEATQKIKDTLVQKKSDGPSKADFDKIKKQLHEERLLRQRLEREVRNTKAALKERESEEKAAANKAKLLADELQRQYEQQQQTDVELTEKVEKCKSEHTELLQLRQKKQEELTVLEQQLKDAHSKLSSLCDLISPYSQSCLSIAISNENKEKATKEENMIIIYDNKNNVPTSTNLNTLHKKDLHGINLPLTSTPKHADEKAQDTNIINQTPIRDDIDYISPTVLASGQKVNLRQTAKLLEKDKTDVRTETIGVQTLECASQTENEIVKESDSANLPEPKHTEKDCILTLETPVVLSTKPPDDDIFVKPLAPMKRAAASQKSFTVKSHKRQLFSPMCEEKRNEFVDNRDGVESETGMSGVYTHNIPGSPVTTIQSEFDVHLLRKASAPNDLYWTNKRIFNYISECPPTISTNPSTKTSGLNSVKRVNRCPTLKKSAVVQKRKILSSVCIASSMLNDKADIISVKNQMPASTQTVCSQQHDIKKTNDDKLHHDTQKDLNKHCPGCQPPENINGPILNSRTLNLALETCSGTCSKHRQMRKEQRKETLEIRKGIIDKCPTQQVLRKNVHLEGESLPNLMSVYEFTSTPGTTIKKPSQCISITHNRRTRVPYSKQEEANLIDGVKKMGKFWSQILHTYRFHPTRTSVDLKDKYKAMKKKQNQSSPQGKAYTSFSMVEDRRLRRGVKLYGYNWAAILKHFVFAASRTEEELKRRWEYLHRSC